MATLQSPVTIRPSFIKRSGLPLVSPDKEVDRKIIVNIAILLSERYANAWRAFTFLAYKQRFLKDNAEITVTKLWLDHVSSQGFFVHVRASFPGADEYMPTEKFVRLCAHLYETGSSTNP